MEKRVFFLVFILCANLFAITSQFRGVNWADKRDNFVSGVLVLSGMSLSDTYESAHATADRIMSQFQEVLGINSVRLPVNEPTVLTFLNSYSGIIDAALEHGRVVLCYWGPAQPAGPKNMNDWWKMWETLVKKYSDHPNAYFEIVNEPHMYSVEELRNLYAEWLKKFPDVPRDHILLDGSGLAWNVPDIANDPRFEGCLFAVHEYTFWNMSITTEEGWKRSFQGKVGKYVDRTVCTEWGGAMSPGEKNGVHYDYMDYNSAPTNYFMAYIRGMAEQLREWQMGSFYWPGLRDGDWYSMTKRSGEGANIKLQIANQSGLDRMQRAWADTVATVPVDTSAKDTVAKDSVTKDTTAKDSSAVKDTSAVKDSSLAIGKSNRFGKLDLKNASQMLQVFSMTGKFMGIVEASAYDRSDLAKTLRQAGFAMGVYLVRHTGSHTVRRIKI